MSSTVICSLELIAVVSSGANVQSSLECGCGGRGRPVPPVPNPVAVSPLCWLTRLGFKHRVDFALHFPSHFFT